MLDNVVIYGYRNMLLQLSMATEMLLGFFFIVLFIQQNDCSKFSTSAHDLPSLRFLALLTFRCGLHLTEQALNLIKIMIGYSHSICATIA